MKENTDGWKVVTGKKSSSNKQTVTKNNIITLHNAYSILSLSKDPTLESVDKEHIIAQLSKLAKAVTNTKQKSLQQQDRRKHDKNTLQRLQESKELFLNKSITCAEVKQTVLAKEDTSKAQYKSISTAHRINNNNINTSTLQQGLSALRSIGLALKRTVKRATGTSMCDSRGKL